MEGMQEEKPNHSRQDQEVGYLEGSQINPGSTLRMSASNSDKIFVFLCLPQVIIMSFDKAMQKETKTNAIKNVNR